MSDEGLLPLPPGTRSARAAIETGRKVSEAKAQSATAAPTASSEVAHGSKQTNPPARASAPCKRREL